jgi:hypothetical protein
MLVPEAAAAIAVPYPAPPIPANVVPTNAGIAILFGITSRRAIYTIHQYEFLEQ